MTFRENTLAVLNYEHYEKMPVVSFGYWAETVEKWANESYITRDEALGYQQQGDNSEADHAIMRKLGFDFNWNSCVSAASSIWAVTSPAPTTASPPTPSSSWCSTTANSSARRSPRRAADI